MRKQTFEEYLQDIFGSDYIGTDDNYPDSEADWFGSLDPADVIDYAEKWGNKIREGKIL